MTNQPDEDDRIPKRLTVEFDQGTSHESLTGSEFLLLILGGAPRAGRYHTEMHRPDGTVETETRVVNGNGRTIKRESNPQSSSSREKRRKTKKRKP